MHTDCVAYGDSERRLTRAYGITIGDVLVPVAPRLSVTFNVIELLAPLGYGQVMIAPDLVGFPGDDQV